MSRRQYLCLFLCRGNDRILVVCVHGTQSRGENEREWERCLHWMSDPSRGDASDGHESDRGGDRGGDRDVDVPVDCQYEQKRSPRSPLLHLRRRTSQCHLRFERFQR